MKKFLISSTNRMAIVDIPKDASSEKYGEIQTRFEKIVNSKSSFFFSPYYNVDGIFYDYSLSRDGANFLLLQMPSTSKEEIENAEKKIRIENDVLSIKTIKIKKIIDFD